MLRLFLSDVYLSVAYIGHKSRTERPRKTKIGTEVAHVTCDSDTTVQVKRSKVNLQGRGMLWRPPAQLAYFWFTFSDGIKLLKGLHILHLQLSPLTTSITLTANKIQNKDIFWYRLTKVHLENDRKNGERDRERERVRQNAVGGQGTHCREIFCLSVLFWPGTRSEVAFPLSTAVTYLSTFFGRWRHSPQVPISVRNYKTSFHRLSLDPFGALLLLAG